ncbi:MAG: M3 family metallopeptidase [Betaproteobacteria bacterium]|nr:M3 family metallopeptidase [Betaproteobacteria bacterium]
MTRLPFARATPQESAAATRASCARACATARQIAANTGAPAWDEVMDSLAELDESIDRQFGLLHHMQAVTGDSRWAKAYAEVLPRVQETASVLGQHRGLQQRVAQLAKEDANDHSAVRRRILAESLADFEQAGVSLPAAQKTRLRSLRKRAAQLAERFERNLRTATAVGHVDIDDEKALADMPDDLRAAHCKPGGGWRFPLLDPSYVALMRHCSDRRARRQMLMLRNARCSSLGPKGRDNTGIIRQLVGLRAEQAQLLGHPSYAQMVLDRRMAGNPQAVLKLADRIGRPARQAARRELRMLAGFAAREYGIADLAAWDLSFVSERLREREFGIAEARIREHFGQQEVIAGLFACIRRLFGVRFEPTSAPVWHPDVQVFRLVNRNRREIGLLYADFAARPGKSGGAWAHDIQTGCLLAGKQQLPVALICCNFSAAGAAGRQPRLNWDEVVTLYHEMGHALHHLLSEQDDYQVAGMNMVEWDAIELPSQFMENFAWRPEVIREMSRHEQTGQPLPAGLLRRLVGGRTFLAGMRTLRQLGFLVYDLRLHDHPRGADPLALWRQVQREYTVGPTLRGDRTPCSFGHIFAGGYAAGYYSYLWAEVLAADAYALFARAGKRLAAPGKRFRSEILARGGSRPAIDNFCALRQRPPTVDALLRQFRFR